MRMRKHFLRYVDVLVSPRQRNPFSTSLRKLYELYVAISKGYSLILITPCAHWCFNIECQWKLRVHIPRVLPRLVNRRSRLIPRLHVRQLNREMSPSNESSTCEKKSSSEIAL